MDLDNPRVRNGRATSGRDGGGLRPASNRPRSRKREKDRDWAAPPAASFHFIHASGLTNLHILTTFPSRSDWPAAADSKRSLPGTDSPRTGARSRPTSGETSPGLKITSNSRYELRRVTYAVSFISDVPIILWAAPINVVHIYAYTRCYANGGQLMARSGMTRKVMLGVVVVGTLGAEVCGLGASTTPTTRGGDVGEATAVQVQVSGVPLTAPGQLRCRRTPTSGVSTLDPKTRLFPPATLSPALNCTGAPEGPCGTDF